MLLLTEEGMVSDVSSIILPEIIVSHRCCCSVAKSCLTRWPHGLQYTRLRCLPLSPVVCSDSCRLSQWCCLTFLFSAALFSFCLQSGSFAMRWLFAADGQNIEASVSATLLPVNIQGWFPLGLTGLISLQFKGISRVFSSTTIRSLNSSMLSLPNGPPLTSIHG